MSSETRDEQRRRVLEVASELFAEHGLDEVTMAEVAAAADVARATVFNYFGSKYALVEAITETVIDEYRDMLDRALADEVTPTPMLVRDLFEEMGKGIESQRRFFREVFREISRILLGLDEGALAQSTADAARARLVRLMQRGQKRNDITADIDAETLADALQSLVVGTITNWLYQDPFQPLAARMRDAADVFLSPVARTKARSKK